MKIGILTHQYINNYGAFLQAWALRKAISELFPEDEVQIIDYVNVKHYIINAGGWFRFYKNRETLKEWFAKVHLPNTFAKARNQEMVLSKRCFNARQINELAFDCIEMLQLLLRLGTFQVSDIVYNTLGGMLGGLCYIVGKKVHERLSK